MNRRQALCAMLALPAAAALARALRADAAPAHGPASAEPSGLIAVPRSQELVLVRPDGYGEQQLLGVESGTFVADPAWHPSGRLLAVSYFTPHVGSVAGGADLALVDVADPQLGVTILLARDRPGTVLATPVWVPDGSGLVFENAGLGAAGEPILRVEWVAWDGSERRIIADSGLRPTVSPDGAAVAYIKSIARGDGLWARPLAGGAERQIVAEYELGALEYPRFSPDGRQIAFAGFGVPRRAIGGRPDSARPGSHTLSFGAGTPRLAATPRAARHGFPYDLYLVDASGANLRRLVELGEDDAAPAWSPDGRWIAVGGASGLRLVSVDDGTVRTIASTSSYGAIDWR